MLEKQLEFLRKQTDFKPDIALVLGSGLGGLADEIETEYEIDYGDIPDFPVSTAPGHKGRFLFGKLCGKNIAAMQGRVHLYEGYTPEQIVMPIRLLRALGAEILILTNACGGISKGLSRGDLMMIDDHISSFIPSPLTGSNDEKTGPRFPDMSEVYSNRMKRILLNSALNCGIDLKRGVYIQLPGPAFETKAEIRMCAALGADAVGMSTAIEAQAARHCGFEVCGISCITNLACGISNAPITSEEVNETANAVSEKFRALIKEIIKETEI
ncbi:inosine guanosine and xanthosine phosphorylase family [Clostridium sp. CAG:678]|nr:inosine guanosine and xanthosine phosphorylase family [Clostridium sp. CAG:678]